MEEPLIKTTSILNGFNNLKLLNPATRAPDQARQVLQHLLKKTTCDALQAHSFFKQIDWQEPHHLPAIFRFAALRKLTSDATGIAEEKLTFSLCLEFFFKLSSAVWQQDLPTLIYPKVMLDRAAREQFKDTFKGAQALASGEYPLDKTVIHLMANVIDTYQLRSFQKLELHALDISAGDPLDLIKNQPELSEIVLEEINRFINTSSNASAYAVRVHGYTDPPETSETPGSRMVYSESIAALTRHYLLTGIRPHTITGRQWTALKLSIYEDSQALQPNETPVVSTADLLKEDPINYSHFKLHPYLTARLSTLDDFFERLDNLPALYQQKINRYWQAPTPATGAKKIWADQLKHYIETEARLRLADGTLDLKSYTLVNSVLSHATARQLNSASDGSAVNVYTCHFFNKTTSRKLPVNATFLIVDQGITHSNTSPVVVFSLGEGTLRFDSWDAFKDGWSNKLSTPDSRRGLLNCMSIEDAREITRLHALHPAQLDMEKTEIQSTLIDVVIDDLLGQQQNDIAWGFNQAKSKHLSADLARCSAQLFTFTGFQLDERHRQLVNKRTARIVNGLSGENLSRALALFTTPQQRNPGMQQLSPPTFTLPALDKHTLDDSKYRLKLIKKLKTADVTHTVEGLFSYLSDYLPTDTSPPLELRWHVLKKVITHRLELLDFQISTPNSDRFKYYFFQQNTVRDFGIHPTKAIIDSAVLILLGITPAASEFNLPYYSSDELNTAQTRSANLVQSLRTAIASKGSAADLSALCTYLGADLLTLNEPAALPANEYTHGYALTYELIYDLPGFHNLCAVFKSAQPAFFQRASAAAQRALAISVVTDYLYPPTEYKLGYICGLNLNQVSIGELPFERVRTALQEHLRQHFHDSTDKASQLLAFTLLSARYAPELLVTDVPETLLYGQTLDAIHFRHAIACMEAIHPCSTHRMQYKEIATAYADYRYTALTENQKAAILMLKHLPSLHFSMCRGVIRETDSAAITHEDSLNAVEFIKQQENLVVQTLTHLAQIPPQRKEIARQAFSAAFPGVDSERVTQFSTDEVKKYFFTHPVAAADSGVGRKMKMTVLEKYMTCANGVTFNEQELGLTPYPQGACTFQALFDRRFSLYKTNFLAGLVSQLCLSLHSLAGVDRERILNAYKYIKVSFKSDRQDWITGSFGLIALYKESEAIQHAYEIFCPSGTIRKLPLNGETYTPIDKDFSVASADELWHELAHLKIPKLNEGAYLQGQLTEKNSTARLNVSFYTIRRTTLHMSREEKIKFLSQKMVDSVFGDIVELFQPLLRSATPFEAHRERKLARLNAIARFVFPGYALYQDIKDNKVTVGTVIFGLLEVLSLLLPFLSFGIKALRVSTQLARIVVINSSLNFSTQALTAARLLKPLRHDIPRVFSQAAQAANPFGPLVLLFQGGRSGLRWLKSLQAFTRRELTSAKQLSPLLELKQLRTPVSLPLISLDRIPPGAVKTAKPLDGFQPSYSISTHQLTVFEQQILHASTVDLSDVTPQNSIYTKDAKTYIYLQNNIYEIRKKTEKTRHHIYKGDQEGPPVTFSASKNRWEITC